jgi:hypothetical protein
MVYKGPTIRTKVCPKCGWYARPDKHALELTYGDCPKCTSPTEDSRGYYVYGPKQVYSLRRDILDYVPIVEATHYY